MGLAGLGFQWGSKSSGGGQSTACRRHSALPEIVAWGRAGGPRRLQSFHHVVSRDRESMTIARDRICSVTFKFTHGDVILVFV